MDTYDSQKNEQPDQKTIKASDQIQNQVRR